MDTFVLILSSNMDKLELTTYQSKGSSIRKNIPADRHIVYYEIYDCLSDAIVRKETLESWPEKKIRFLIDFVNPLWEDWKDEIKN